MVGRAVHARSDLTRRRGSRAFLRRPEEWVTEDLLSGWTVFGVVCQHRCDQLARLFAIRAQVEFVHVLQVILLNVEFTHLHPTFLVVVRMITSSQDPEEQASERKDVCCSLYATDGPARGAFASTRMRDVAVAVVRGRIFGLRDELRSLPSTSACVARRVDQRAYVLRKCFTQAKV